jgi:hypothetical protein
MIIARFLRGQGCCGHLTSGRSLLLPTEALADETELVLDKLLLDRSFSFVLTLFVPEYSVWIARRSVRVLIILH